MTCEKIASQAGVMFVCARGSRKKPPKPQKNKQQNQASLPGTRQLVSAHHNHRAESTVHLSVLTGKRERRDAYVSVWGPSRFDPRFEACRVCGKAKPVFGRPKGKKI